MYLTHQINQINIRNGSHPLVFYQRQHHQNISHHGKQKDDDVQRYHKTQLHTVWIGSHGNPNDWIICHKYGLIDDPSVADVIEVTKIVYGVFYGIFRHVGEEWSDTWGDCRQWGLQACFISWCCHFSYF